MTPYQTLGVPVCATEDEIRSAYRRLVLEHHPDKGGCAERFQAIGKAYELLRGGSVVTLDGRMLELGMMSAEMIAQELVRAKRLLLLAEKALVDNHRYITAHRWSESDSRREKKTLPLVAKRDKALEVVRRLGG